MQRFINFIFQQKHITMWFNNACFVFNIVSVLLILSPCCLSKQHYHFRVEEAQYTRLCHTKKILTVNGLFPGPSITVNKGDTIYVTVYNRAKYNITIHWHGVKLPRYPWSDGPEYITQCPIQPGKKFKHKVIFSTEDSTLWWHAHSDWSRATVHGAIVIYPKTGVNYPFAKPYQEQTIILAEWWKKDIMEVLRLFRRSGGDPNVSDAYTINGQPGDLYPCSKQDTFKLKVLQGQHYLLRIVNAAMNDILFFAVAKHKLTVVAVDGGYTKPYTSDYITISPGQTMDCLLDANQEPGRYYMAARSYSSGLGVPFDNTTATAIVEYRDSCSGHIPLPNLPYYNDTKAAFSFIGSLRSLSNDDHPFGVPTDITTQIISTVSVNTFPCPDITNRTCEGPNTTRLAASMNNISFMEPSIPILEAYYYNIKGVFGRKFPSKPPLIFNFTADYLPLEYEVPKRGRQVKVVAYNSTVEIVYQGTNLVAGIDHPMHLHGYSFYMVGWGFGNFDKRTDPQSYNLVDPLYINTVTVPKNGWVAIRFKAANPGIWFLHCHFERHLTWGMETVFIVKNGNTPTATILPPPPDMPPCKI